MYEKLLFFRYNKYFLSNIIEPGELGKKLAHEWPRLYIYIYILNKILQRMLAFYITISANFRKWFIVVYEGYFSQC